MWLLLYLASSLIILVGVLGQDRRWTRMVGTTDQDESRAVAVDSDGFVYVTGHAEASLHGESYVGLQDIVVMKYSSNGTRIWTKMSGTSGSDSGFGVAVDNLGHLYVTGVATGDFHGETSNGGADLFLMKYSTNGTRIWTKMAGSSAPDRAFAVAVDVTRSCVYVTGMTSLSLYGETNNGNIDVFLMKFSTNGTRIWTRLIGGPFDDYGYGVAVDSAGYAYVAGEAVGDIDGETSAGTTDIVLVKFASDGSRVWTRLIGSSDYEAAYGIAVDSANSAVYVVGLTYESFHGETIVGLDDVVVLKYHTNGTRVWTKITGSTSSDYAIAVAVDGTGAVFVAGFAGGSLHGESYTGSGSGNMLLMKYTGSGTRLWTRLLGSSGEATSYAYGVAVYGTGPAYISGYNQASVDGEPYVGSDDIILVSYNNSQSTMAPTSQPTGQPSVQPSQQPTQQPSAIPTAQPSNRPSAEPSAQPSGQPSAQPSAQPSGQPSGQPSAQPSAQPVSLPSGRPSAQPSAQPVSLPSGQPSAQPSAQPVSLPSGQPSAQPSVQPVSLPSGQPSAQPSAQPVGLPSGQPSAQPSVQPVSLPSGQPSTQPSSHPSEAPDKTICRYLQYRQISSQADFTTYVCIRVPGSYPGSTFRRRLASPETTLDSTTRQAPSTIQDLECSAFSASDTAHASNAQADYSCQFKACPGDRVRLSMRPADGGSCSGYPVLRLIEGAGYPSDSEVLTVELAGAFADGSCPVLVYDFRDLPQCQHFTVVQGCEESSSCSGQATIHYYVSP